MEFAPMVAGLEELRTKQRKSRLKEQASKLSAPVKKAWTATDAEDRLLILGLAFLGLGIYRLNPAYAEIIVGVVLILAVRPIRRWF